jgi:hypothetical protein
MDYSIGALCLEGGADGFVLSLNSLYARCLQLSDRRKAKGKRYPLAVLVAMVVAKLAGADKPQTTALLAFGLSRRRRPRSFAVRWSPVGEPLHLTDPFFSSRFSEHPVERLNQGTHCPLALGRQSNPAMLGMACRQGHEIPYIEREDAPPLRRSAQELDLVIRLLRNPVIGRARHIVPAVDQRALQLPD